MAIDPYEPELAKRKKAFQIAYKQLSELMNLNVGLANNNKAAEFVENFRKTEEALRDYEHTGRELSEWLSQKNQ